MIRHLLVIGAQRSGSTYLASMLDAHPDIAMARPSRPEPKVFCSDELCEKGLGWYRQTYFAHARHERVLGDKSTSYLEDPKAPARAAEILGEAHVVAVLRDPVARAVSNWQFSTQHGFETRPLEEALRDNLEGEAPWDPGRSSVSPYAYLERGRYVDHLEPWLATFPETSHVLLLDELVADESVLDGLLEGLGVARGALLDPPRSPVNENPHEAPALNSSLRGTLAAYFQSSNHALSTLLGRDLPW